MRWKARPSFLPKGFGSASRTILQNLNGTSEELRVSPKHRTFLERVKPECAADQLPIMLTFDICKFFSELGIEYRMLLSSGTVQMMLVVGLILSC